MRFKLSVRELEILDKDRIKILKRLRESHLNDTTRKQSKHFAKKPMKPPILVVPLDDSRLFCIIQRCKDYDEPTENDIKDGNEDVPKPSSSAECCKELRRQKGNRDKLIKCGGGNKRSTLIQDDCNTSEIEEILKGVPKTSSHTFTENVDEPEV